MGAFGLYSNVQLLRDVLAVEALAEGLKHLFFAGSKLVYGPLGFVLLLALAADHSQHLYDLCRREQGLPGFEPTHGLHDLAYRGGLVQHAGGAGLYGLGEAGRLQAGAKNQRHHIGTGSQLFDQLEPIPVRQREVHDRDVHPVGHLADEDARLGQRACLARHDELLLSLEHEGQGLPERGVILDEQDPGRILPSVILYDSHPSNASMPVPILPQAERAGMAPLPFDQAGDGYREAHPRPLARRALHTKLPAELESPVPHGLPAYTGRGSLWVESTSVVGHLDVGELTVETQLYPNVASLGVSSDVRERLLDETRQLLACFIREPGWKIVLYYQFYFVPSTGHPPVQIHEVLERGDHRAVQRLFEAQLEDGAA